MKRPIIYDVGNLTEYHLVVFYELVYPDEINTLSLAVSSPFK